MWYLSLRRMKTNSIGPTLLQLLRREVVYGCGFIKLTHGFVFEKRNQHEAFFIHPRWDTLLKDHCLYHEFDIWVITILVFVTILALQGLLGCCGSEPEQDLLLPDLYMWESSWETKRKLKISPEGKAITVWICASQWHHILVSAIISSRLLHTFQRIQRNPEQLCLVSVKQSASKSSDWKN